jgi:hypothetical protein
MVVNKISIINQSSVVEKNELVTVVAALQSQISNEFANAWGIDAKLTLYDTIEQADEESWQLIILDFTYQQELFGIHDLTSNGLPLGKVFAASDIASNLKWSVTASHELLEMLGDPDVNLTATKTNADGSTLLYAYENCDACEADIDGYKINGVTVSDFVYPSWFQQFQPQGTTFDYQNKIIQPFQILPGGYAQTSDGNGWNMVYGDFEKRTFNMRAHLGSRREKRTINRNHWLKCKTIL